MQAFGKQLTTQEIAAVITYERNAWGNNTGDAVQAKDVDAHKSGGTSSEPVATTPPQQPPMHPKRRQNLPPASIPRVSPRLAMMN